MEKALSKQQMSILGLLLAAGIALPFFATTYYTQFASKLLLTGLLAMALNLVIGFAGLVSMCHAAFYGIAGYTLVMMAPQYQAASLWITLPAAVAVAAFTALIIGALSLRTRGIYFIMVTLAFGEMLFFLFHDTKLAGGSDGAFLYFKPEMLIMGKPILDLEKPAVFYLVVLALVVLCAWFLSRLIASPFGAALKASKENERRAASMGFPLYRIRLTAYVISGAIAGLAGYFAVAQFGFVAPQMLSWHVSAIAIVMVVLGGQKHILAPLLGAAVMVGLEEVLKSLTEHWKLIEGILIISMVLLLPNGLFAPLSDFFQRGKASSAEENTSAGENK